MADSLDGVPVKHGMNLARIVIFTTTFLHCSVLQKSSTRQFYNPRNKKWWPVWKNTFWGTAAHTRSKFNSSPNTGSRQWQVLLSHFKADDCCIILKVLMRVKWNVENNGFGQKLIPSNKIWLNHHHLKTNASADNPEAMVSPWGDLAQWPLGHRKVTARQSAAWLR